MSHPPTQAEILNSAIENCAKEPIHIPGSIQGHGILLALRASDLTIIQVSENVYHHLGIEPTDLLHQPISTVMDIQPILSASKRLGEKLPRLLNPIPIDLKMGTRKLKYDGILHRSGRALILELEPHIPDRQAYGGFGGFYEAIREITTKIVNSDSLDHVFELTCDEVRRLTGFSRVVIYQFDQDWNGSVINESSDGGYPSLLGHRFPASDIPKQARDLYTTNWLRLIPNVDYAPSPLVPINNPLTDSPLDLSNSVLRSVSPVHREYMRNLGQCASMSISLLKGHRLWGLISCHHPEKIYLKYDNRVACEFVGQMVSAQIAARTDNSDIERKLQLKAIYDDLVITGAHFADLAATLIENSSSTLALVDAQGAAICLDEVPVLIGRCPQLHSVHAIRRWFVGQNEEVFATSNLSSEWPNGERYKSLASGVLGIKIPRNPDGCILWFRPEQSEPVKWGGNPHLAKEVDGQGRLHPRKSFETWLEHVDGISRPWLEEEISVAKELRSAILAMALRSSGGPQRFDDSLDFRKSLAAVLENQKEPGHSVADDSPTAHSTNLAAKAIDAYPDIGLAVLGKEGRIDYWSAGARRLLGYNEEQMLGKKLDVLFSEELSLKLKHERILDFVREHKRCEEQLWLFKEDSKSFWGKIMVARLDDSEGGISGFSAIFQDITKEKAAEEDLKATRFAAEAANQAKTAFLANISHEIRTPLGALLGFSSLMNREGITSEERDSLHDRVTRNGLQLTSLINDLLDMAKVEAGKIILEEIATDLAVLLIDLEQTMIIKAAERSISFNIYIANDLPRHIISDPTRLRQIFVNLVSNALKFTPPGGNVTLSCATDKGFLVFRVIDSGKGMTEEEASRLFRPFVQADSTITRKHGGTGLGLFVSRRLANALGGDLIIEYTEPDKGTVFKLEIEIHQASDKDTFRSLKMDSRAKKSERNYAGQLTGARILVVDDSADNRDLIGMYLAAADAEVSTASDGQEGVLMAMSSNFDLVLMDIQMPKKDGNQAMAELKAKGYDKPIIALTAHAMIDEKKSSLEHGFRDYITKPIDRELLIDSIRQLTGRK